MASDPNFIVGALEALRMMECPVCMEVIHPPAFQCHNGHLVCSSCLDQISLCPTCRSEMPSLRIRNLLAENFVSQKCPNAELGCQVRLTSKDRDQHVLNCEFKSFDFCRRVGLEKVGTRCSRSIKKCDISSHMKNEHNLTILESSEAVISQEIDPEIENIGRKWFPITFFAFGNYFFLNSDVIEDKNGSEATLSWECILAGSVEIANGFSVELTLFNSQFNTRWLKWQGGSVASVEKINGNSSETMRVLSVPLSMLHQFNQTVGKLKWNTKIVIKQNNDLFNQLTPSAVNTSNIVIVATQSQFSSISSPSAVDHKRVYKHILGKYEFKPARENDSCTWDEIIYSVNGTRWTKKLHRRRDSETLELTFNLGGEYQYVYKNEKRQATINIVENMVIRKEKISDMNGTLIGKGIEIQEFMENEMVSTLIYKGVTQASIYRKVVGYN